MRHVAALLVWLAFAGVVRAQEDQEIPNRYFVQYTVEATLRAEADLRYDHPLLMRLSNQPNLVTLNAEDIGNLLKVRVLLQFGSLEAFRAWYASDETRALMRDLQASGTKTHLAVQRRPG